MDVILRDSIINRARTANNLVRSSWPHELDALHDAEIELGCCHELFEVDHQSESVRSDTKEPKSSVAHFELFLAKMQFHNADGESTSLANLTNGDLWLVWLEYNANMVRWVFEHGDPEHEFISTTLLRMEVAMLMASPIWRVQ
ncbi:hypothetical protein LYSHEL_21560 [Lysobacter helvus]|uniref:Uncharacterized protein n=2 Tax=Lysobacteraceae TaxID=32033 RepID=A0ABN6FZY9_9GAMM|nr:MULTISPECIES: hypothetical protein [Lysobacter]BCT93133.1 hypothetical protein LYSCAS_21570 [Lysobacter caseinilyticus]BCT96285.1 hypothetical protein LYSHEL_21560 [Lysobacter helvus]